MALFSTICWAAGDLDQARLLSVIERMESGGIANPDGALTYETLPDGTHTTALGRFQITETTWKMYTRLHYSWAVEPGRAKGVAALILLDCQRWYPGAGAKRIFYCWTAGREAVAYKRKAKRLYAEKAAALYAADVLKP